jgi:small subunit ribosomal protein S20
MPNHKSAEKRDRQNERRNAANTTNRSRLRTQIKKLRAALAAGKLNEARELQAETVSIIDKSVQKGILHRNTAARHKARLTMSVNKLALKS